MALGKEDQRQALAAHGFVAGTGGFDLDELAGYAEARGWTWTTTPSHGQGGRPGKWRASVMVPYEGSGRCGTFMGSRGRGDSEAEALAVALATTLARKR